MLNNGQKRRFAHDEKARFFQDAKQITDLLDVIIESRTQELMNGNQRNKHPIGYTPNTRKIKKELSYSNREKQNTDRQNYHGLRRASYYTQVKDNPVLMIYLLMSPHQATMTIEGIVIFSSIRHSGSWGGSYRSRFMNKKCWYRTAKQRAGKARIHYRKNGKGYIWESGFNCQRLLWYPSLILHWKVEP